MKKSKVTKAFFVLSVYLLLFWGVLGTSITLAWYTDMTPVARNTFYIDIPEVSVAYKNDTMTGYAPVNANSPIFPEGVLYEPGYTQVVWLRIANGGEAAMEYKISVNADNFTTSYNKYGIEYSLPPYLRFGVIFSDAEIPLTRETAQAAATCSLNTYSPSESVVISKEAPRYAALVLYMPETVGNEANHHPNYAAPQIDLGITIFAQQAGTPQS